MRFHSNTGYQEIWARGRGKWLLLLEKLFAAGCDDIGSRAIHPDFWPSVPSTSAGRTFFGQVTSHFRDSLTLADYTRDTALG
jgi:hypothetical protein